MWIYKVIVSFRDLQDGGYLYHVGDVFPRDGQSVAKERINELKTSDNKAKKPLIKAERKKKDDTK